MVERSWLSFKSNRRRLRREAEDLLDRGSAGILYPSARHKAGTCIACFRPALVAHVRKGAALSIVFRSGASAPPEIRETK